MSDTIIGIDLGTTNSEVAVYRNNKPEVIEVDGFNLLPSVVGLDENDNIIVGNQAKNQLILQPERTIKSIKRQMGSNEKLILGTKEFTPAEISSFIIKKLKNTAELFLNQKIEKAVITVPAYFSDAQKKATREAGELAGLTIERIINEPTAATLVYKPVIDKKQTVMVYDLGGGTFDVSIIEIEDEVIEVKATTGNNELGGDDFDRLFLQYIIDKIKDEYEADLNDNIKAQNRLMKAVEKCKIDLSTNAYTKLSEENLFEKKDVPQNINFEISRFEFEDLIIPLINNTFDCVRSALETGGYTVNDIDEIILVGGSSRIPLITEKIKELYLPTPHQDLSPELCVALGASVQGAIITDQNIETVLVDITPYTFGTRALRDDLFSYDTDHFVPIIYKNSPLPAKGTKIFTTAVDNQEEAYITVFQGENPKASDNIFIGDFLISDLSPVPKGNEITISYKIDLDGLLHIEAEEKSTGQKASLKIEKVFEQAAKNLHEETDELVQNEGIEETDDIDKLITRAEKLKNEVSDEDKKELENLIQELSNAKQEDDIEQIYELKAMLEDMIFYME